MARPTRIEGPTSRSRTLLATGRPARPAMEGSTQTQWKPTERTRQRARRVPTVPSTRPTPQAKPRRSDAAGDGASDAGVDGAEAGTEAGSCAVTTPVCDAGCPIAHSDGLGQTFYDCAASGTMDETQALEACTAYTGSATFCANDPIGCANADEVCTTGTATCTCWDYRGMHAGFVFVSTTSTCSCFVASPPSWN
jgi:hypothetical protein